LLGPQRLAAVPPGLQFGQYRIMTAGASLRLEEAAGALIDVGRIGMQRFPADIRMAVHTHDLPVRRNVPPRLVHQPISADVTTRANDGKQGQNS
jgi:hypothetical protein